MKVQPVHIFVMLCMAFLIYSVSIYTRPLQGHAITPAAPDAVAGKLVYQKYNCQACHQMYGLGGYLGPDLTNIFSEPGKNEVYISAVLKTGNRLMPPFMGDSLELEALMRFLKSMNATGNADPRMLEVNSWGMTDLPGNKSAYE